MHEKRACEFNIPCFVSELILRLENEGESAYIVGGSLRDMLLGNRPHDFDLASSAEPLRVCEIFSDMRVIKTGLAHGTVTVISHGEPVEITTFRVDGEYIDMRRPLHVEFTRRIEDDLSRRDFTVNAMAYNESYGLIDLFGGAEDIKNGVIRTVGDPYERFGEDALRIMRAFRFSAQLGFEIDVTTLSAARELADKLTFIARERIFSELLKLICSPKPSEALRLMIDTGVIRYVLPDYIPSERALSLLCSVDNDEISRLAALFSDADGAFVRRILSRLLASRRQKRAAAIIDAAKQSYSSREDVTRLKSTLGEDARRALQLSVMLGISSSDSLAFLNDNTPYSISQLAIGGAELMALGYEGREIGTELSRLLDAVIAEPSLNVREKLIEMARSAGIK